MDLQTIRKLKGCVNNAILHKTLIDHIIMCIIVACISHLNVSPLDG